MPIGTGADLLQGIPTSAYVTDPSAFFANTVKNQLTPIVVPDEDPGQQYTRQLLQTGIVSKLRIAFSGSMTVATAAVTVQPEYPYNLLESLTLSANGQNQLINCSGLTLHALRNLRYPAFNDATDEFPTDAGDGDIDTGTYPVFLTWEVPIAIDDTTLVGSLYAQSSSTNLTVQWTTASLANIFATNPGNVTFSGSWVIQETVFAIPFDAEGRQIVPDLSRMHAINEFPNPFTNTGDTYAPLIRSEGQLSRLLVRVVADPHDPLSADPAAANASKLDRIRLQYGGNQQPLDYQPASLLQVENNQNYGNPLPYDFLCLDFIRENPIRDALMMQGVTDLNLIVTVNSAVTVGAGQTFLAQETLF